MARYNEINVGHFNRLVQKFTGIKGGPPSPQLSGDFQPVIPIPIGNEVRYLGAWNQFGARISEPANAGTQGGVQLTNPFASNVIAVITRIFVSITVVGGVVISFQSAAAGVSPLSGTIPASAPWDSRASQFGAGGGATCSITGQNNPSVADLANQIGVYNLGTINQSQEILFLDSSEFPLLPSTAIRVRTGSVNTGIDVTYFWRERFLEESERS